MYANRWSDLKAEEQSDRPSTLRRDNHRPDDYALIKENSGLL
jgi:hypothetical protein